MNCNGPIHSFPSSKPTRSIQPLGSVASDQSIPSASPPPHWVLQTLYFTSESRRGPGGDHRHHGGGKSTLLQDDHWYHPAHQLAECTLPVVLRRLLELAMAPSRFHRPSKCLSCGQLLATVDEIAHLNCRKFEPLPKSEDYIDQPVRVYSAVCKLRFWPHVATAHAP